MGRPIGLSASLLGLTAIAATVWWLNQPLPEEAAAGGRPPSFLPVTLATVERGRLTPRVVFTGTVKSPSRVALAFDQSGRLSELSVREVDPVSAGQVLARLESTTQHLQVAAAEADLALARSELALLEAGARSEVKARLQAQLAEQEALVELARVDVQRLVKLAEGDVVSRADIDHAKAAQAAAEARAEAARQSSLEARAGTRSEDIAIAAARVAVQQAALAQAQRVLEKTDLVAPSDGVVLRRLSAVGAHLNAGQAVFELVDLGQLEIEVEIPSRYAARLGDHPTVTIHVDEHPEARANAVLDAFVPAADEKSRNFRGLVRLPSADPSFADLRPGMFVRVALELETVEGSIVPSDSLRIVPTGTILVVAKQEGERGLVASWQPVRVLASDTTNSAVESLGEALPAGARVVVTGVDLAYPGASLFLRPEGGAAAAAAAAASAAPSSQTEKP